ncbi:uncharacterized protein LOC134675140 [Cydia fagiglandana]|uniref:uncharacterized protein LOC134675140 n=1 Tax=Cydia fagiglandana TaxID=1458189 RepID=UPI002FEDEFD8
MSSCNKCGDNFVGEGDVPCSCCGGYYHYRCSGMLENTYKRMTAEKKSNWRCIPCRQSDNNDSLSELVKEFKGFKVQMQNVQSGLDQANQGIANLEGKFDLIENRLEDFDVRLTLTESKVDRLPSIEANLKQLEAEFVTLKANERDRDQFCRLNNVEISGVPQKDNENLMSILNNICLKVGFGLLETDVDSIHRVRRFPLSVGSGNRADPRPPAIIVRFCQRRRKDELVAAARARRGLTSADAGLPGPAVPVYVNEHLTAVNKILLRQARDRKAELNYSYLWVKQCKIHMRKSDSSKVYVVTSEADLKKLK